MEHLAIMDLDTINKILSGKKLIESRFSINKITPYKKVNVGDIIFLKQSGKPIIAKFEVSEVKYFEGIDNKKMDEIKNKYNYLINAPDDYWKRKQNSNYGTLISIINPKPITPMKIDKKGRAGFISYNNINELIINNTNN